MLPKRLKEGDHIRVIAPAESFFMKFTKELEQRGVERLNKIGLQVSFGKHVRELGPFDSANKEQRLADLHQAFEDDSVDAIIAANGGASANQLLKHIDYELIERNPKIFCGLSDITELTSAIYTETRLVTYYGPNFTMIGASQYEDYLMGNFKGTFYHEKPLEICPTEYFSNSPWSHEYILNEGPWTINPGEAEGNCLGGNMLTLNFLLGYQYIPEFENVILFLEENKVIDYKGIQKELQQILNHPDSDRIKGIVFGRFQRQSKMNRALLTKMVKSKQELAKVPVIGNVDLGHTVPTATFPFGGRIRFSGGEADDIKLEITEH